MNTEQVLAEIREANLSYLMLAQTLIRCDRINQAPSRPQNGISSVSECGAARCQQSCETPPL